MLERVPLADGWELVIPEAAASHLRDRAGSRGVPAAVPATVPGCVHRDLVAAGLVPDPLHHEHEHEQQWIGYQPWTYRTTLTVGAVDPDERVDLVFDGLDTFATVSVNGRAVGSGANQHRTYRFDVTELVEPGDNELAVHFDGASAVADARLDSLGDYPNPYGEPYNLVRKMACNFGWDWGPRLTTAGVWRPVRIERWATARLAAVRPRARCERVPVDGEIGRIEVVVEVDTITGDGPELYLELALRDPDGEVVATATAPVAGRRVELAADVPAVRRWWPHALGPPERYRVEIALFGGGRLVDTATCRVGFRSVELDRSPHRDGGTDFAFVVNARRLWIRGFNWIPDGCFPDDWTAERVRRRIDQARAARADLLRVWGGGVYESDEFYDWCDERGMLVWQDFAFACAAYPEDELDAEVRAEATDNIARLMHHPSLIVWSGNNECLEGWWHWEWQDTIGDKPWGSGWYRSTFPDLLGELDPDRPYIDGSPTSIEPELDPMLPDRGTLHMWDVWNRLDYHEYRRHRPRFAAEFGYQSAPSFATLFAALPGRSLRPGDGALANRRRTGGPGDKLTGWIERHHGAVTDLDEWLFLGHLDQARALDLAVRHLRSLHGRCNGAVWWQLNDCWAGMSWSVVDVDGRLKPSWYAARRAFADRIVTIEPEGGAGLAVSAINVSAERWTDEVSIVTVDDSGATTGTIVAAFAVEPGGAERVDLAGELSIASGETALLVATTGDGDRAVHDPSPERDRTPPPSWTVGIAGGDDGVVVDVAAGTLVRDLCLFVDRLDPGAEVDEQFVTLLPGERHRFRVTTEVVDPERWREAVDPAGGRSAVLRAAGDRR